jgi:glycosyltransferase involved in cell wall biosynthesis
MMKYEVTIGIPVYRVERYIEQTLLSALSQDFANIEFLVLDDRGEDGSIDIVRRLQQEHPRGKDIRIVSQPRNMGIGHGRNRIIDEAMGRYLLFLDSDDYLPPHAVSVLYEAARKYDAQIVYGSNERVEEFDGQETKTFKYEFPFMVFDSNEKFCHFAYERYDTIPANVWRYLIDIRVYRDNGLRFYDINFWEDFAMTMDLPTYIERAVLLPVITYRYYSRYETLSNNQKRDRIEKLEIEKIAAAISKLKENSNRLKGRPYYLKRSFKVMMTEFYMVCYVLSHKQVIVPSFSTQELRNMMRSPLSLGELCGLDKWKLKNLALWLLGAMPAGLSVSVMKILGKRKGLI